MISRYFNESQSAMNVCEVSQKQKSHMVMSFLRETLYLCLKNAEIEPFKNLCGFYMQVSAYVQDLVLAVLKCSCKASGCQSLAILI